MNEIQVFYDKNILFSDQIIKRDRSEPTIDLLKEIGYADIINTNIRPVNTASLYFAHDPAYVKYLMNLCKTDQSVHIGLNDESIVTKNTYEDAKASVDMALMATKSVINGKNRVAFALTNPGHHSGSTYGGGFCFLNNMAVSSKYAIKKADKRILILDWDAHFGNGTCEILENEEKAFILDIHEYPLEQLHIPYEIADKGTWTQKRLISLGIPSKSDGSKHIRSINRLFRPIAESFTPDLIMISAGQDGHYAEWASTLFLNYADFAEMAKKVNNVAMDVCDGKIVLLFEGGYNNIASAISNVGIINAFLDNTMDFKEKESKISVTKLEKDNKDFLYRISNGLYGDTTKDSNEFNHKLRRISEEVEVLL